MPLTKPQAQALAAYASDRRGWDVAGCMAQLGKVARMAADDVAMAWVRFCADSGVKTPGAFPSTTGPHWSEKVAEPQPAYPPRSSEACDVCGRHEMSCVCRIPVADGTDDQPERPRGFSTTERVPATDEFKAARAALRPSAASEIGEEAS